MDQAIPFKQLISGRNCSAIQAKSTSQFARRWQTISVRQGASFDRAANLIIDLAVKRGLGSLIYAQEIEHANQ
jgi:hypothetical protein